MTNNASMEETLRAEVECLRKVLAEKDKEIQHLHELLDLYDREREEQEKSYEDTTKTRNMGKSYITSVCYRKTRRICNVYQKNRQCI